MAEGGINDLAMEQYLRFTRGNQALGVVKPKIRGNVNFKIKSQFIRELREDTFSENKNDDAHEHVERVLVIVSLFNIPGETHDAEGDEALFQAWDQNGIITCFINAQLMTLIAIKRGAHLDKECPQNEEVKSIEEVKYGELRGPLRFSNRAKYRVSPPGYYTCIGNRQSFGVKKPSLEELMNKHLEESTKRRAMME
nr:hypothetical protein [Tanacetum cinerariifolium]